MVGHLIHKCVIIWPLTLLWLDGSISQWCRFTIRVVAHSFSFGNYTGHLVFLVSINQEPYSMSCKSSYTKYWIVRDINSKLSLFNYLELLNINHVVRVICFCQTHSFILNEQNITWLSKRANIPSCRVVPPMNMNEFNTIVSWEFRHHSPWNLCWLYMISSQMRGRGRRAREG